MTRTVGAVAAIALLVTACSSGDDTAGATTPSVPTAPSATTASTLPESTLPESTLPESALPETTAPATRPHGTRLDVEALAAWLDESAAANPTSPGELVTVLAPGTDVSAAGGSFDIGGDPLTADASFRIASVTKTFTAAATLRLVEIGALRLDDDLVSAGLPNELVELLRADGYDGTSITVAHLLDHSSGIYDYAFGDGSPYVSEVLADPAHVWTVGEQVAFATAHGDPLGAPGEVTGYSDTGYVLLGSIVEQRSGRPLGEAFAELLRFDELGLDHTYVETPGSEPLTRPVVQRFGDVDVWSIDASVDLFGGGGLVSTTHDLAVFFRALWAGGVFDDPASWVAMTTVVGPDPATATGIFRGRLGTVECWYHLGFWGVEVFTCPSADLTVARSWNQASPEPSWSHDDVLGRVVRAVLGSDD